MKKLITCSILSLLVTAFTFGQVPDDLKNIFKINHPTATSVVWSTVEDGLYKVSYRDGNVNRVKVYDRDMKTVWSKAEIASAEIPIPVREYISVHYPAENYPVLVLEQNGESVYYISDEKTKKTFYLDKEGRVVKTVYESRDYPKNIAAYFTQKYPQEAYTVFSEDADGKVSYYTVRKGKMIYFDKEGNYIREDVYYDYDYEQ